LILILAALSAVMALSGCSVYFNTFYNAKKAFGAAEKARDRAENRRGAGRTDYQTAIEKALKVIEQHPNSKYYDDALFILAVSYFHTEQYGRAERRFREIIANYGDTKWARESTLYLAQAKLGLLESQDAMVLFEAIFTEDYDAEYKADAAMALGEFYFEEQEYDRSENYFRSVRDSLGDDYTRMGAQMYIADGYFASFQFNDALGAYLQVLGMEPDKNQRYHSLFRAADCSYQLLRVDDGMEYLNELIRDELYFDSLGILQLKVAEGYELDDDLLQAEVTYEEVVATSERQQWRALALYRLGLIYQLDREDLQRAKEYYDESLEVTRTGETGVDALQRSSDIAKLETLARTELDSAATQDDIDAAAYTQYLLSELHWYQLDQPDSAIAEMQFVVDSFPTSYWAPRAAVALAEMKREFLEDNQVADSILKSALISYPGSDFTPEVLSALGLVGTAADTGYAGIYISKAEEFLVDKEMPDSALVYYQYVVDQYPDSKFYLPARFATVWVTENHFSEGDSSVYFAYQEIIDSFPSSEEARQISNLLRGTKAAALAQTEQTEEDTLSDLLAALDTGVIVIGEDTIPATEYEYLDPRVKLYLRPNGDSLVNLKLEPIEILREFEFPEQAAAERQDDWILFYQLLVDFSGEVIDYKLAIPSGVLDIDERANETIESMTFNAVEVSNRVVSSGHSESSDGRGYWFVYEYRVTKPEYLK